MARSGCIGGECHPSVAAASVRCQMHAAISAKETMEKQGWVCINEYGHDTAQAVDSAWLDQVQAVHMAGVTLQKWMAGWDATKQVPLYGIWAPRPVAAILAVCQGKIKRDALAQVLKESKINAPFVQALDAAWRLGGHDAALEIIKDQLPQIARQLNQTIRG